MRVDFISIGPRGEFDAYVPADIVEEWIAEGYAHGPHDDVRMPHRPAVCAVRAREKAQQGG